MSISYDPVYSTTTQTGDTYGDMQFAVANWQLFGSVNAGFARNQPDGIEFVFV